MNAPALMKFGGVLLGVLVTSGVLYLAYSYGVAVSDLRWKRLWAEQQVLQAKGFAAATASNRIEEQRRQTAITQVGQDARDQTKNAVTDASGSDAAGERVRAEARNLITRAGCPGEGA